MRLIPISSPRRAAFFVCAALVAAIVGATPIGASASHATPRIVAGVACDAAALGSACVDVRGDLGALVVPSAGANTCTTAFAGASTGFAMRSASAASPTSCASASSRRTAPRPRSCVRAVPANLQSQGGSSCSQPFRLTSAPYGGSSLPTNRRLRASTPRATYASRATSMRWRDDAARYDRRPRARRDRRGRESICRPRQLRCVARGRSGAVPDIACCVPHSSGESAPRDRPDPERGECRDAGHERPDPELHAWRDLEPAVLGPRALRRRRRYQEQRFLSAK
jgi:hypothetical protein